MIEMYFCDMTAFITADSFLCSVSSCLMMVLGQNYICPKAYLWLAFFQRRGQVFSCQNFAITSPSGCVRFLYFIFICPAYIFWLIDVAFFINWEESGLNCLKGFCEVDSKPAYKLKILEFETNLMVNKRKILKLLVAPTSSRTREGRMDCKCPASQSHPHCDGSQTSIILG